jgi:hypothetical protein
MNLGGGGVSIGFASSGNSWNKDGIKISVNL